jgi:hypothetical protein
LAWRLIRFNEKKQDQNFILRHARNQLASELATGAGDPDHLFARQVIEVLMVVGTQHHSIYSRQLLRERLWLLQHRLDLDDGVDGKFEQGVIAAAHAGVDPWLEQGPTREEVYQGICRFFTAPSPAGPVGATIKRESDRLAAEASGLWPFDGDRLPLVREARS